MTIKRAFTLLEMMIALVILSLIGALTAVQVKKLIDAHRFEGEVADLFIALQEAQVLSATYNTDLSLDLYLKEGKVFYRFSTDEPLSVQKLKRDPVSLAHTTELKFKDVKVTSLHLDIYSGGRIEPRGTLSFSQSSDDGKKLWFDLQHGQLLKFSHRRPSVVKQQVPSPPKE
ncbi:MAG: type II secretion system protein [Verrucomicrobia bacterium]|nr:type II secretion system protein [Verrucomicrobiota bacterium]